jgi:hypothetical protein
MTTEALTNDTSCDCKYCKLGHSDFCEIEREENAGRYPDLKDSDSTIFYASDAGGLIEAAKDTVIALRKHGFNEHATTISRSMARLFSGSSMVRIGTLKRWDDLFEQAYYLLLTSPIDDPSICDFTADLAQSFIVRELRAFQAGAERNL